MIYKHKILYIGKNIGFEKFLKIENYNNLMTSLLSVCVSVNHTRFRPNAKRSEPEILHLGSC